MIDEDALQLSSQSVSSVSLAHKNMQTLHTFFVVVIVVTTLLLQPIFGQPLSDEQHQTLAQLGIMPYPLEKELKESIFSTEGFKVLHLNAEDISEDFSNIEDLGWLAPIAREHRVILVGENHYYQYTQHLRNRILFALNTFDYYPTLIVERQYSSTPFFNYYLNLEDDEEASIFMREIRDIFLDETDMQLLQHLRRWNTRQPERKIQIGCTDIEHAYSFTFQQILLPYFTTLARVSPASGESFKEEVGETLLKIERMFEQKSMDSQNELNQIFYPVEQWLALARKQGLIGKYPFLTPKYIGQVIENLKSFYLAKTQDFFLYRQRAIIRNLTDSNYLGAYFTTGKVMLHGGDYHTATHYPNQPGKNFLREGSYLTYEFKPTKGRSYSLAIWGRGVASLGEIARVDLEQCGEQLVRSGYRDIVRTSRQAVVQGLLAPKRIYVFDERAVFPKSPDEEALNTLLYDLFYQYQNQPILFQQIPWERLLEHARQLSSAFPHYLMEMQERWQWHDLTIVVPVSPLVRPIHQK